MKHLVFRRFTKLLRFLANLLPLEQRSQLAYWLVVDTLVQGDPRVAARELLQLDNDLYQLHGQVAIRENGGIHPKHSLTNYHDFFSTHITSKERVLDFGAGIGAVALAVAEVTGASVDGIELLRENVEMAKKHYAHPRVRFFEGDGLSFPLDANYDVVILSNVLEHLDGRPEALKALCIRSGAQRMLIRVPAFDRDWRVTYKRHLGVEWRLDEDHRIEYTQESLAQELAEAGLRIVTQERKWGEIWVEAVRNSS